MTLNECYCCCVSATYRYHVIHNSFKPWDMVVALCLSACFDVFLLHSGQKSVNAALMAENNNAFVALLRSNKFQ